MPGAPFLITVPLLIQAGTKPRYWFTPLSPLFICAIERSKKAAMRKHRCFFVRTSTKLVSHAARHVPSPTVRGLCRSTTVAAAQGTDLAQSGSLCVSRTGTATHVVRPGEKRERLRRLARVARKERITFLSAQAIACAGAQRFSLHSDANIVSIGHCVHSTQWFTLRKPRGPRFEAVFVVCVHSHVRGMKKERSQNTSALSLTTY